MDCLEFSNVNRPGRDSEDLNGSAKKESMRNAQASPLRNSSFNETNSFVDPKASSLLHGRKDTMLTNAHTRFPDLDIFSVKRNIDMHKKHIMVGKPTEITGMTRSKEGVWKYGDRSGYAPFCLPKEALQMDLSVGYDYFKSTFEHSNTDSLECILGALFAADKVLFRRPHIVSWRGILTKIMTSAYLHNDDFQFTAWKHNGILYLGNRASEEKIEQERNLSDKMKRFMYSGYKFEELCTRPPNSRLHERLVDPRQCYCRIFKTSIGRFSLICGAEMDCYDPVSNLDLELKVTSEFEGNEKKQCAFERFKLLKYYCQSFLSGVNNIVVGYRDEDMMVRRTETFKTLQIPRKLKREGKRYWNANSCLHLLEYVLDWLDKEIPEFAENDINTPCFLVKHFKGGRISISLSQRTSQEVIDKNLYIK